MVSSLLRAATALVGLTTLSHAMPQSAGGSASPSAAACNNSPLLCGRAYNNMTHMGAHDSSFLRDASTGNSIAGNQYFNATVALSAGIRLLQAQVHVENGTLRLCHTTCALLDAGPLAEWLARIRFWMDNNPNDVVTLLLVNSDGAPASSFGDAFDAAGLSRYGFVPSGSSGWPTLSAMITAGQRLVTFVAPLGAASPAHPFLLDEFAHVFETAFDVRRLSAFNCTLDRPRSSGSASAALQAGLLPLVNHFAYTEITSDITVPNVADIATTNNPSTDPARTGALGLHLETCAREWAVTPVFALVDFYDQGPAIDAADRLNGIVPTGRKASGSPGGGTSGAAEQRSKHGKGVLALVGFLAAAVVMV